MRDKEYNERQPEYYTSYSEYNSSFDEHNEIPEFNSYQKEINTFSEENDGIFAKGKSNNSKDSKTSKAKRSRSIGKSALQLTATCLSSVVVLATASSLSNGTFMPELNALVTSFADTFNEPLVSVNEGLALDEVITMWNSDAGDQVIKEDEISQNDIENSKIPNDDQNNNAEIEETIHDCTTDGHTWGTWTIMIDATCESDGMMQRTCQNCDKIEIQTISALGHDFKDWTITKEATCEEDGQKARICDRCNKEETQIIEATGHDWSTWQIAIAASCTENGEKYRECSNCHDTQTRVIEATGHDYEIIFVDDGVHQKTCSKCSEASTESHSWSTWDTNDVEHYRTCSGCGHKQSESHDLTYSTNGDATHSAICQTCNHSMIEDHVWSDGTCLKCGASVILENINLDYMVENLGFQGVTNIVLNSVDDVTGNVTFIDDPNDPKWENITVVIQGSPGDRKLGLLFRLKSGTVLTDVSQTFEGGFTVELFDSNGNQVLLKTYRFEIELDNSTPANTPVTFK